MENLLNEEKKATLKRISILEEKTKQFDLYYPELVKHSFISEKEKKVKIKTLLDFSNILN
jgi:hypothetical protein